MEANMQAFLQRVVDYIDQLPVVFKYLALILSVAIEYILPIFPGDTIVLLAGFLKAKEAIGFLEISISVVVGSVLGALLGYGLGRLLKKNHHKYRWVKTFTEAENFDKFNRWYRKWGVIFLLANRFLPGIRALFFIAAGAAQLPMAKVIILGTASAILYNGCLIALGYWLGYNSDLMIQFFYRYNAVAYGLIVLAAAGILAYFLIKRRKK